ncbi:hypothetical protein SYNPS1DRAFT_26528 [Syncephalis pseudoplumigaleata]|uniref:NAA35-like TPR repeats domain-containing protein n=1 Tax=Syncephalis pseudoplumigaleata TaxID=1712513 RepID=A0A4P9Z6P3_9FUNG|nr:hypothetical protein SYNPS1DRAFT_26528 [Syncephalis pseudoplumigaleata]|eukprot:RKP27842.1 hypothetical protein SYNPS1DRAFT_26528 [Syncephalis pseudoplumigaleata]
MADSDERGGAISDEDTARALGQLSLQADEDATDMASFVYGSSFSDATQLLDAATEGSTAAIGRSATTTRDTGPSTCARGELALGPCIGSDAIHEPAYDARQGDRMVVGGAAARARRHRGCMVAYACGASHRPRPSIAARLCDRPRRMLQPYPRRDDEGPYLRGRDEDFSCYTFGISLAGSASSATDAILRLEQARLEWQRILDAYDSKTGEEEEEEDDGERSLVQGIVDRLAHRQHFLASLMRLGMAHRDAAAYALIVRELQQSRQALERASTAPTSTSIDIAFARLPVTTTPDHPARLVGGMLARMMVMMEARTLMRDLLLHLEYACYLASMPYASMIWVSIRIRCIDGRADTEIAYGCMPTLGSLADIQRTLLMERLQLPGVLIVGRQFTRELLTMDGHRPAPKDYTFTFTKPNIASSPSRPTVSCGKFLDHAAQAEELDALWQKKQQQQQRREHGAFLTSWVYHEKLTLMCDMLMAGFELQLYGPHEYFMITWYIYQLSRKKAYSLAQLIDETRLARTEHGHVPPSTTHDGLEAAFFEQHYRMAQMQANMQLGLLLLLAALCKLTWLATTRGAYDREVVRFTYRFRVFSHLISPPAIDYVEYQANLVDMIHSSRKAWLSAREAMAAAAQQHTTTTNGAAAAAAHLIWYHDAQQAELKARVRVCIANTLALQRLSSLLSNNDDDEDDRGTCPSSPGVSFQLIYHARHAVVSIE